MSEDEIRQLAQTVWETTLGIPLTPQDTPSFASGTRMVVACVQITGAWGGAVFLHVPEPAARAAAAGMFQCEQRSVRVQDMQEAVAELGNMVAGNIKALLPEPSCLSLPTVVEGGDFSSRIPGSRLVHRVVLSADGQDIAVTVVESVRHSGAASNSGVKAA
ncbi:MAG: chemotaxis protein CheX [Phycisphaerales bacterium]